MFSALFFINVFGSKGSLKKNKKHLDGLSPTYLKPPPPAPPKNGLCFFFHHCFIVLFQFLDIIFTLKVKKKHAKVDSARNPPPPLWTKSIQMFFFFFFFFLTSLSVLNCIVSDNLINSEPSMLGSMRLDRCLIHWAQGNTIHWGCWTSAQYKV